MSHREWIWNEVRNRHQFVWHEWPCCRQQIKDAIDTVFLQNLVRVFASLRIADQPTAVAAEPYCQLLGQDAPWLVGKT